ncbi:MAG: class I SAM-dependent methyltransferase [Anaerolineales bacterium]
MTLALDLAHRRYQQQAGWTAQLRRHIFARAGLPNARRMLEIGCGTGAVLSAIGQPQTRTYGLDIDRAALRMAQQGTPGSLLAAGDAHHLPYEDGCFDIAFFHFVLLWLAEPVLALTEACRVTRRGGAVIAFAEPDYSQRIDKPDTLSPLGQLQTEALRAQGAHPDIGGHLPQLFQAADLAVVESGQLQASGQTDQADALELEVLQADLSGRIPDDELQHYLAEEACARRENKRILHVPTFFAIGRVS